MPELERVDDRLARPAESVAGPGFIVPIGRDAIRAAPLAHSKASTAVAQRRPSSIAHTISDWPRRASPAAKTPGTLDV